MTKRGMGKTIFADVRDRSGRLQIYARKDELGDERFLDWGNIERGDIVGIAGYVFRSKMGELTLHVTDFAVLTKSLAPLPDKWSGLQDVEKRYRQRYVDLIVNDDVRDTFIARSTIVAEMRRFIDSHGFLEVDPDPSARGRRRRAPVHVARQRARSEMQLRIATELNSSA